jgi:hypothetical protein
MIKVLLPKCTPVQQQFFVENRTILDNDMVAIELINQHKVTNDKQMEYVK